MEYELKIYATEKGKEPFKEWLHSLKDYDTQALGLPKVATHQTWKFRGLQASG